MPRIAFFLAFQMERMVRISAGITPGKVHDPSGEIDDQRVDRLLPIQRITFFIYMVANRTREINMIALDSLERFYRVLGSALEQA